MMEIKILEPEEGFRQELQNLCGLSEVQAINILNGFLVKDYMAINEREWVKNERKRIKAENN